MKGYPFWGWLRPYRGRYALGLLSLFAVDGINVGLPLVLKEAIDALTAGQGARVGWLAALYVGLMGLVALLRYFWRVFLIGSSHLVARDLRLKLYGHLLKVGLGRDKGASSGDLMSRATNDVESIRLAVGPGILVAVDSVMLFLMIVPVMGMLSGKLTLLAFAFFPLLPWITARFGDRIDALFESLQFRMSRLSGFSQESLASSRLIKSLGLEGPTVERFLKLSGEYREEGLVLAKVEAPFSPLLTLLTYLGFFLILLFGGQDVLSGAITLGTFVAFQRFVVQLSWPMEAIGWAITMNREGVAAYRRLSEVLTLPEVRATLPTAAPPRKNGKLLEIPRLRFAYPTGNFRLDVEGLSLERGKRVGIVGPVGSGKSTLFHLILRLYEPEPGSLYFGGRDVLSIPLKELRHRVASVEQGIFLFSETLGENVSMGARPLGVPELEALAETAAIGGEIDRLPQRFQTPLGERGVTLSGGQKQRVALMRALGREPELLLLDDAFSAVDVEVEHAVLERYLRRHRDLSLLFVSHRLSAMPYMDEIWVFSGGKVVSLGDHRRLLRESPWYEGLWEKEARP